MSENARWRRPLEDVVTRVVDRGDDRDPERVRAAFDPVTDDGAVTEAALTEAVSDTSKLVATAETRVELAGLAYDDAVAAADPVADLAIVASRLDDCAARLDDVETRAAALCGEVQPSLDRLGDPPAIYELALDLREVATTAQNVARTADDLAMDLETFEAWLESPARRYDEVAADIDQLDAALTELAEATTARPTDRPAPAIDWALATMQVRVIDLLVTDLQAELAALRTWADRENLAFRHGLADRVAALDERAVTLADRLADRADPAWRARFGEELAAFTTALDPHEPPVDWGRVHERLAEWQTRIRADG